MAYGYAVFVIIFMILFGYLALKENPLIHGYRGLYGSIFIIVLTGIVYSLLSGSVTLGCMAAGIVAFMCGCLFDSTGEYE